MYMTVTTIWLARTDTVWQTTSYIFPRFPVLTICSNSTASLGAYRWTRLGGQNGNVASVGRPACCCSSTTSATTRTSTVHHSWHWCASSAPWQQKDEIETKMIPGIMRSFWITARLRLLLLPIWFAYCVLIRFFWKLNGVLCILYARHDEHDRWDYMGIFVGVKPNGWYWRRYLCEWWGLFGSWWLVIPHIPLLFYLFGTLADGLSMGLGSWETILFDEIVGN